MKPIASDSMTEANLCLYLCHNGHTQCHPNFGKEGVSGQNTKFIPGSRLPILYCTHPCLLISQALLVKSLFTSGLHHSLISTH
ncbi:hypothetical protein XENTR_v10000898 [Xenopus tropicalis]|nr:hypothetical protein XENTR_v10000898 [Xenopus tropicalis]